MEEQRAWRTRSKQHGEVRGEGKVKAYDLLLQGSGQCQAYDYIGQNEQGRHGEIRTKGQAVSVDR